MPPFSPENWSQKFLRFALIQQTIKREVATDLNVSDAKPRFVLVPKGRTYPCVDWL